MRYQNTIRVGAIASLMAGAALLAGCQTGEKINIATYAPVIDVKGQGYDQATYHNDLQECRDLGLRVQATYEEQRKKEQSDRNQRAFLGAALGAAAGHALGQHNEWHPGRTATTGAVTGAVTGAAVGGATAGVDYGRTLTKFGPTAIVDRCMTDRGYKILSAEGFGGG